MLSLDEIIDHHIEKKQSELKKQLDILQAQIQFLMKDPVEKAVPPKEAAGLTGLGYQEILDGIQDKDIPTYGRSKRVKPSECQEALKNKKSKVGWRNRKVPIELVN